MGSGDRNLTLEKVGCQGWSGAQTLGMIWEVTWHDNYETPRGLTMGRAGGWYRAHLMFGSLKCRTKVLQSAACSYANVTLKTPLST